VVEGADRLIGISRELLVLARAEAGAEPPRFEVVALGPLLAEALADAGVPGPESAVHGERSASVFADPDLLQIAVVTLVQNARRYSSDGTVTVDVRRVTNSGVLIEIVNPAQAPYPERLQTLKTRFASGGGRDAQGFGVGLSIAERAVSLIDGRLTLGSGEGRTTARIE